MQNIPYSLSNDYEKLFNLMESGYRIVGYVKDPERPTDSPLQMVECYQVNDKFFIIGFPGKTFASVMPFHFEHSNITIKEAFLEMVKSIDFQYIDFA